MPEFVPVTAADSIPAGQARAFSVGRYEVAVFHVGGAFFALRNRCPHQGGPLAEGWIEGTQVTCPWHAWTFKLTDGKMTLGDYASVDPFDVRVEGDQVRVSRTPRPS